MKVKLIFAVVVTDYHDIEYMADSMKSMGMSSRELGTTPNGNYVGIIFDGNSPGDGEVEDVLARQGINLKGR